MTLNTEWIKQTRLAKDKILPFQIDSLFLTFVIIGFHKEALEGIPQ